MLTHHYIVDGQPAHVIRTLSQGWIDYVHFPAEPALRRVDITLFCGSVAASIGRSGVRGIDGFQAGISNRVRVPGIDQRRMC
jgi:hypothetical protein